MKARLLPYLAIAFTFALSCAMTRADTTDQTPEHLPYTVKFELGQSEFAPGDSITIKQVHGTSRQIVPGGTYSVEGTYTLNSKDEATLGLHDTSVSETGSTPVDPKQRVQIKKGTGSFYLVKTMTDDGYLHVSFYSGSSFGDVYFGQGDRVLRPGGPFVQTNFYIGQSSFPKSDAIEITSVERYSDRMVVKGQYNLVSADSARLGLFITTTSPVRVPSSSGQLIVVYRGQGGFKNFTLTDLNVVLGMPHVTLYSIPDGGPFASVYFGTKEEAAEESSLNLGDYNGRAGGSSSTQNASPSAQNNALLEYLGSPVAPPPNLDARYTAQGLTGAVLLAAQNAGIQIKNVMIDDSEFPCLVGVICGGSDFPKLKSELNKMDSYQYGGGVGNDVNSDGSDTCNVFNIIPYRAFPRDAEDQIYHRLGLREQAFQEKITSQEEELVPTHAQPKLPTTKVYLGDQTLDAELAVTRKEMITGMMFRTNIQETDAMLFVLPSPQRASFWMKNCPEPIAAAYIGPDGDIEEIHHLQPNDTTPVYASSENIQFVLETKDGWFERHNIGVGTVLHTDKGSLGETFLQKVE